MPMYRNQMYLYILATTKIQNWNLKKNLHNTSKIIQFLQIFFKDMKETIMFLYKPLWR